MQTFDHVDPGAVPDITDRQFARGLWGEGIITYPECEAFVGQGTIPAALQRLIDALPDDDTGAPTPRKEAVILITGLTLYRRQSPLVAEIAQGYGWSPAEVDAKFRAWAAL